MEVSGININLTFICFFMPVIDSSAIGKLFVYTQRNGNSPDVRFVRKTVHIFNDVDQ